MKFRKLLVRLFTLLLIFGILVVGGAYVYAKLMPKLEINAGIYQF